VAFNHCAQLQGQSHGSTESRPTVFEAARAGETLAATTLLEYLCLRSHKHVVVWIV
jgi:hypothetical protein